MTSRPPSRPASVGTAVLVMAVGGVLAFGVRAPAVVTHYVDLAGVGLVLVWAGVLLLVMQVVLHRRPRPRRRPAYDDRTVQAEPWETRDVHRPGYAGRTQALPTVRGRRDG